MARRKKFQSQKPNEPEDWFSDIRREDIGFKYTINYLLLAITKAAGDLESSVGLSIYSNLISHLEVLLVPYWDKDYEKAKKFIESKKPKDFSQLVPNPDDRYRMLDFEKEGMMGEQYHKLTIWRETERLKALMRLLDKKGLLFERQTYEVVG